MTEQEKKEFVPPDLESRLRQLFPELVWVEAPLQDDQWQTLLREKRPEIILCAWETPTLPPEVTDHLKYVCYLCGSIRKLVPRELIEQGLQVTNWGSTVSNTVAECSLLLILAALRRVGNWSVAMRTQGKWKQGRHPDTLSLFGRRVGLHGLGAISRDLVRLLEPFRVQLSAYSPSVPDETFEQLNVRRCETLEDLFSTADVLVELAPGKPDNHHLVGDDLLKLLPEQAVFVNLGRGHGGRRSGAWYEPVSSADCILHLMFTKPNRFLLTRHCEAWTTSRCCRTLAAQLRIAVGTVASLRCKTSNVT